MVRKKDGGRRVKDDSRLTNYRVALMSDEKGMEISPWSIGLLVVILGAILLVVYAPELVTYSLSEVFPDGGAALANQGASQWAGTSLDLQLARGAILVLAFLLVFSIIGLFVSGKSGTFVSIVGGVAGAYLLTAFILPAELYAAMIAYSAVGLALTIAMPIFILLIFTGQMLAGDKVPRAAHVMLERFVWLFFFMFLIYKVIIAYINPAEGLVPDQGVMLIMLISAVFAFGVFFFHRLYLGIMANTLGTAFTTVLSMAGPANARRKLDSLTTQRADVETRVRILSSQLSKINPSTDPVKYRGKQDQIAAVRDQIIFLDREIDGLQDISSGSRRT